MNCGRGSISLAFATRIAQQVRRTISRTPPVDRQLHLDGEALTATGFLHYTLDEGRRLDWVRNGLQMTLAEYDGVLVTARQTAAHVALIYNPTSYEIYRELIPLRDVDLTADAIAQLAVDDARCVRACERRGGRAT